MRVEQSWLNNELWRVFTLERERGVERDQHGRVLARSVRGDHLAPVVSELLYERGFRVEWPNGKRFAVCLTHDVDFTHPMPRHAEKALRSARSWRERVAWRLGMISGWRIYNPFSLQRVVEVEREFSAVSSFMVKATPREWIDERYEDYYGLERISGLLRSFIDEGWEVGLHGGYSSHNDPQRLVKEKEILERALEGYRIIGVRMHYLRFTYPETWLAVEAAGFKYDTTLAFPDYPGFRNGMCYPFNPVVNGRVLRVLEIPLAVMDTTFWGYMRVQPSEALEIVKGLAARVEKVGGVLTVLWHNNTFCELLYSEWARMYESMLSFFREKGAWLTNCLSVLEHWMSHYG